MNKPLRVDIVANARQRAAEQAKTSMRKALGQPAPRDTGENSTVANMRKTLADQGKELRVDIVADMRKRYGVE